MRRLLLALVLVLVVAGAVQAEEIKDSIWGPGLDKATLINMLERGQLVLIERDGWKMSYRNCAELISAPSDKVWDVVSNFAKYYKFIPEMTASRVKEEKDGLVIVDFTIKVKVVAGITTTVQYDQAYRLKNPIVEIVDVETGETVGAWQVVPADDGKRTLLFYRDLAPDIKEMSSFLAMIVEQKPDLEVALQVSPVSVYLTAMKKRSEALYGGK